ncbi:hypothetical protein Tco_0801999 [Tanacetum coccineum]|uniref:Reverse transcriptase domain-containing protein n=1 Tax=Tanacetum coccineum TaxID=301880 RepID=A0ABQ5A0G5_9ASTR
MVAFADEGSSNSDTDKIMARMDAMTMKMDAQFLYSIEGTPLEDKIFVEFDEFIAMNIEENPESEFDEEEITLEKNPLRY